MKNILTISIVIGISIIIIVLTSSEKLLYVFAESNVETGEVTNQQLKDRNIIKVSTTCIDSQVSPSK